MKHSTSYVWQKAFQALNRLCGEDDFNSRLKDAAVAFCILDDECASGELKEPLKYVFKWTKKNLLNGALVEEPNSEQRKELIECLVRILVLTSEHQGATRAIEKVKRHQRN